MINAASWAAQTSILGSSRIYAEGEMADRTRDLDWSQTPVGAIMDWPEALVSVVNLVLESQFPTLLLWREETIALYNDALLPILAEKHPRALSRTAKENWSEAWHVIGPQVESVMREGKKLYFENLLIPIRRHGVMQDVYWTYSYSPVRDGTGAIKGVFIVCHDVTAKLTAERERDAIAANLQNVLDSTTDGFAILDQQWRYTYVNDRGAGIVGLKPGQMLGNRVWELFPQAYESQFGQEYRRAVETRKPSRFDAFYPTPLNAWIECHCYPNDNGLSIYFRDVTVQRQTQRALKASESRFRKLFESDLMGIAIPDRFGTFRESNDELLRMTGYSREDLEAGLFRWDWMTPPEYTDLDIRHIQEAAQRGSCTPYEKEYIRKDGTRVPILCGYALLEDTEDAYIGFVMDMTDQKLAGKQLRQREERFSRLAESLPQLIWMTNREGGNVYCNQRFTDYFGKSESDLMGWTWSNMIHPDDLESTLSIWKHCLESGDHYLNEYRLQRKDGMFRYFLVRAVPVRNEAGEIELWIGSSTDIHDQKLAEDALRKSEKLATVGRLAASIAHEINNPLAAVTNCLYIALLDPSLHPETKVHLQNAEQELRRVAHITTQTLRFHKQSYAPARIDISEIANSVLALFRMRMSDKGIRENTEFEQGAIVTCLGDEIRQVIANLVSNAMDATPANGTMRIRIRKTRYWANETVSGVKIVVADTGHGIPAQILDHIFEPFVTTKEATGIGLGLWVSDGIVRKHGGRIRVRSRAGCSLSGSIFSIFLPNPTLPAIP